MILIALISAAVATTGALTLSHWARSSDDAASHDHGAETLYQCPMHPSIVQDHPGNCPICGMKLVKIDPSKAEAAPKDAGKGPVLFYRSPMDPKQTSPTPRKDEMGMDYLPVYKDEASGVATVPGFATVEIDANRQQLIGMKTTKVTKGSVGGAWRTVGRIAIDETRVRHINLKISGFVEHVYVDFVGKHVKRGDPLFSIYSPDLLSAQEEYLLALKTKEALSKSGGPGNNDGDDLVAAARRKLALWDVPAPEIDRIARTGKPTKTLTFYSPVAGVVTKKDIVDGMKLDAGAMPYEIVDLSEVWVLADVYESELRFVKKGMTGSLKLNAFPNRDFKGAVVFIDPLLDPKTRTVKVRLTFPNPTGELRPEMFGEVVLFGAPHDGLRIPPDAVIDSGTEKIVFVAVGDGKFQPRKVTVGDSDDKHVEVLTGLTEGEPVVVRANFLIDSESRLRASLAAMTAGATTQKTPESARVLPDAGSAQPPPSASASGTPKPETTGSSAPGDHSGHGP